MICTKCGKKNSGNAVFCQYCGTKLDKNVANSRKSDTISNFEAGQVCDQLYAANRRKIKMSKWKRVTSIVGVLSLCFMLIFFMAVIRTNQGISLINDACYCSWFLYFIISSFLPLLSKIKTHVIDKKPVDISWKWRLATFFESAVGIYFVWIVSMCIKYRVPFPGVLVLATWFPLSLLSFIFSLLQW